jgi:hypothetical protein
VVPPHRTDSSHPAFSNWLRLASSGWYLQIADVLAAPRTAVLVSEDASWYFAFEDWQLRRPRRGRRAELRAWREEERLLADEQARLVEAMLHLPTLRPLRDAPGWRTG